MSSVVVLWNWFGTNAWMNDLRDAFANFEENLSECLACCAYVIPCSLGCFKNVFEINFDNIYFNYKEIGEIYRLMV